MLRNRKSSATLPVYTRCMLRLRKPKTKQICRCLCITQAVVIFSLSCFIIMYHPSLLEGEPEVATVSYLPDETAESVEGFTNKLSDVTNEVNVRGEKYVSFRFDKFRTGMERDMSRDMVKVNGVLEYFSKDREYFQEDKPVWVGQRVDYEPGRFEEYGGRIVRLEDVKITPNLSTGKEGGENLYEVLNQNVELEYLQLRSGYFTYHTKKSFAYDLPVSLDLHRMAEGLQIVETSKNIHQADIIKANKTAIVTIRHEYANFYHSIMNWYDVFLIMVIFKIDQEDVEIIWLDAHPKSRLDATWNVLYGRPIRAGALRKSVQYKEMIWNGIGARSQINSHKHPDLPFVNEFRHFVLHRFSIQDGHKPDCNSFQVTIIWRHDKVFHPRNPSGFLSRKIENEEELWRSIKDADNSLIVTGVQLDDLSMSDQLMLISRTDILIGMHGAGLSHILFLPKTSGVIELYPGYFSPSNSHFRSLAKWRRMPYMHWLSGDNSEINKDHRTTVPPLVLQQMVRDMKRIICKSLI